MVTVDGWMAACVPSFKVVGRVHEIDRDLKRMVSEGELWRMRLDLQAQLQIVKAYARVSAVNPSMQVKSLTATHPLGEAFDIVLEQIRGARGHCIGAKRARRISVRHQHMELLLRVNLPKRN